MATLAGPEDDVRACVACVRSRFTPPTLVPMPIPCDDDDDDVAAALTAVGAARGSGPCFVTQWTVQVNGMAPTAAAATSRWLSVPPSMSLFPWALTLAPTPLGCLVSAAW